MLKTPFMSQKAVVSSENPIASYIGTKVLEKGGNFVDATIATSLTLALTIPHLGGLGGDFFALLRTSDGKVHFINGSGYSPKGLTLELLIEKGYQEMPQTGPLSIVVPGLVDALRLLSEKFGTKEWKEILDEVILRLKQGFPLSYTLSKSLLSLKEELSKDYGSRTTYYDALEDLSPGTTVRFNNMIKALEVIKEDPRNFYEGDIAVKISEYVQSVGGVLSFEDMKEYRAFFDEPIMLNLDSQVVYEMPPNTQGVTTLHLIKMLSNIMIENSLSLKRIKEYLRAFRVAYWIRDSFISDPKDMKISVEELLKDDFLERAKQEVISKEGIKKHPDGDTTYFAISDQEGNVISAVQSLFYPFGSRITEPTYGITLNARASSFSLDKNHVNVVKPRKRPLHTLSSMIIEGPDRIVALGLSGGHFRPQLHVEIFNNIYSHKMNIQEALDHPRFVWPPWSNIVEVEEGYESGTIEGYEIKFVKYPSRLGVAGAVELKKDVHVGYCDIRGEGIPWGLI